LVLEDDAAVSTATAATYLICLGCLNEQVLGFGIRIYIGMELFGFLQASIESIPWGDHDAGFLQL